MKALLQVLLILKLVGHLFHEEEVRLACSRCDISTFFVHTSGCNDWRPRLAPGNIAPQCDLRRLQSPRRLYLDHWGGQKCDMSNPNLPGPKDAAISWPKKVVRYGRQTTQYPPAIGLLSKVLTVEIWPSLVASFLFRSHISLNRDPKASAQASTQADTK